MPKTKKEQAQTHYQQGMKAYKASDHRAALASFQTCAELYKEIEGPTPYTISFSQGLCYKQLGDFPKALELFNESFKIAAERSDNASQSRIQKQIQACQPKAQAMLQRNYTDTSEGKYLYVPQGHAVCYSAGSDDAAGAVTNEFSNCQIICLSDAESGRYLLLHGDAGVQLQEIEQAIHFLGEDCKKEVVTRTAGSELRGARGAAWVQLMQLGDRREEFTIIPVDDSVSHVMLDQAGVHCLTDDEYKGTNVYHPFSLSLFVYRKLNLLLGMGDPQGVNKNLVIYQDRQWTNLSRSDVCGTPITKLVIELLKLTPEMSFQQHREIITNHFARVGILDQLQQAGQEIGSTQSGIIGNAAKFLQMTHYLAENNFAEMLRVNLRDLHRTETAQGLKGECLMFLQALQQSLGETDDNVFVNGVKNLVKRDACQRAFEHWQPGSSSALGGLVSWTMAYLEIYSEIEPVITAQAEAQSSRTYTAHG